MKIVLLVLSLLISVLEAKAATQALVCSAGAFSDGFEAVLDDSTYDAGSGFFDVKNASVQLGFATAHLICAGHKLNNISCVGFWFGHGDMIVNVTTKETESGIVATTKNLTPGPVAEGETWKCSVR